MCDKIKKMFVKYHQLSKEKKSSVWYAISNILQKGILFFTIPIITRIISTSEYGVYSVFVSWRDILIIFATLNLYCGVFTKILVDNKKDQRKCTSTMQGLGWFFTLVFTLIYISFKDAVEGLLRLDTISMVCFIGYFFFFPAFSLWCTQQRVNYEYKKMVLVTILLSIASPCLSIALLYTTNARVHAVIIGNTVCYIIAGLFFSVLNFWKGRQLFSKKYWLYALKYNIPLIPHYLSIIVLGQSDRIMIEYYCGEDKAGIYSLAYQISSMMNIVFNALNYSFVPRSYELLKRGQFEKVNKESLDLLTLTAVMTGIALMLAPECVLIMGGAKYLEAIYIIPPVCMGVFITFLYGFFNNIEFYYSHTKNVMIASTVSALTNVILNFIFIPKLGYIAAGYTTLISYFVLAFAHYIFARRIGISISGKDIYDSLKMLTIVGVLLCFSIISLWLYNGTIIRYCILLGALIIVLKNRNILLKND